MMDKRADGGNMELTLEILTTTLQLQVPSYSHRDLEIHPVYPVAEIRVIRSL